MLRSYLGKGINPSLIVLQLCSNDIINNYFPIEVESYLQRPPAPRPYLEGSVVTIRFPRKFGWIIAPIISVSRLGYRFNNMWDKKVSEWAAERKIESVEFRIQKSGFSDPLFRNAVGVTDELLGKIKEVAGKTKLVLMLIDDIEPYTAALRGIARKYELPIIIPPRINPIPADGRLADGTHLNEDGNKIIGETFVASVYRKGLLAD